MFWISSSFCVSMNCRIFKGTMFVLEFIAPLSIFIQSSWCCVFKRTTYTQRSKFIPFLITFKLLLGSHFIIFMLYFQELISMVMCLVSFSSLLALWSSHLLSLVVCWVHPLPCCFLHGFLTPSLIMCSGATETNYHEFIFFLLSIFKVLPTYPCCVPSSNLSSLPSFFQHVFVSLLCDVHSCLVVFIFILLLSWFSYCVPLSLVATILI
jgi:hypothetical protein